MFIEKTLFVLVLRGRVTDSMFMFYCADQAEAEEQAKDMENEFGASRVSLRQHRNGFRLVTSDMPGLIQVAEDD
jgi:hypothetical protein